MLFCGSIDRDVKFSISYAKIEYFFIEHSDCTRPIEEVIFAFTMKNFITFALLLGFSPILIAQPITESQLAEDAKRIKTFYQEALRHQGAYNLLVDLTEAAGGSRLSGSDGYDRAANYVERELEAIGFPSVERQSCTVTQWQRGKEDAVVWHQADGSSKELKALALGNSGSSDGQWLKGEVVLFMHIDSVATYQGSLEGKIAFFARPFDQSLTNTFRAYSGAVAQRVFGPNAAAKKGAIATIVRSMASNTDYHPHTGVTVFDEDVDPIPAMAISTADADALVDALTDGTVTIAVRSDSRTVGTTEDDNLIGEITGSTYPDEIILAGGHLDSWDIGDGAHDDGAGCAHVMDAFRILFESGYKPKRTWRCVLFANEENGLAGATKYAEVSNENKEFHLAAIESDAGGHTPKAFSFVAENELSTYMKRVKEYFPLLEPYGLDIVFTGSGADIAPLKSQGGLLIGFRPDSQRYFDYHHSTNDNLENVHPRELSLGAAAIASLIYLIDNYGIK